MRFQNRCEAGFADLVKDTAMSEYDFSDKHCSLDSRGSVSLVTNLAVLPEVQLGKHLEALWRFEKIPISLLPTFMHEMTHHWCFNSPVGYTLAYLQLRARRKAISIVNISSTELSEKDLHVLLLLHQSIVGIENESRKLFIEQEVTEDVLRYETTLAVLRPIAEGIALFAEFDVVSRSSSVRSTVLNRVFSFFALDGKVGSNYPLLHSPLSTDLALSELLLEMRLSDYSLKRKESLLVRPLSTKDGGYLLGYLTVKRLWRFTMSKCDHIINNPDLFMMFLRSFFYDDYGLVAILLDPKTQGMMSVNAILEYIQRRFYEFFENIDFDYTITQFERMVKDEQKDNPYWITVQTNPAHSKVIRNSLENLIIKEQRYEMSDILLKADSDVLARREFMFVGNLKTTIHVDLKGEVSILLDNKVIFTEQATKDIKPGTGQGSISLFFSTGSTDVYRAISIIRDGEVVSLAIRGILKESTVEEMYHRLKDFIHAQDYVEFNDKAGKWVLEKALKDNGDILWIDHLKEHIPETIEHIYSNIALSRVPDKLVERCHLLMHEHGFYQIINEDISLIRALVLLGNCCSVIPYREVIAQIFTSHDLDLEKVLVELSRCIAQYGALEIIDSGSQLFTSV